MQNLNASSPQHLYSELVEMLPSKTQTDFPAVDIGCSVGRLTHELGKRYDFAIGIDHSFRAVRIAREITAAGGMHEYYITLEGHRKESRTIDATGIVTQNVEFIVSDVATLPFGSDFCETVLVANMLDVVEHPVSLLYEIHRILRIRCMHGVS